jgi:peptidoglycan/xylan/chitin deacetylase (PgdA/CDA1 family)
MFFVMGENIQKRPKDFLKIVNRGHRLGNHTWDHPFLTRLKDPEIQKQLKQTDDLVTKLTGKSMAPHWRPPFGDGARDSRVLKAAADIGFTKMWFWDIDSGDTNVWKDRNKKISRSPAEMVQFIIDSTEEQLTALAKTPRAGREGEKGKYVVLAHDKQTTVRALEILLPRLQSEGYSFVDFP